MKEKITTGPNARPKHDTIAQTDEGLPDDSGTVIEVDEAGAAEVHKKRDGEPGDVSTPEMPYDVDRAHGTSKE